MTLNTYIDGAEFSPDRKYRYALWRVWDASLPSLMVIGLNPSKANESKDDPTIKKVKKIAANNGFGRVFMLNLFPLVSTDPGALLKERFQDLAVNYLYLHHFSNLANQIVFAWGNFKEAKLISFQIMNLKRFQAALCIHQNKDGSPKHPLYCSDNSQLILFNRDKIIYSK